MLRKSYLFLVLSLAALALCSSHVLAQQVAVAQVSGQVSDPSGAALSDATVKMTEVDTGIVHTATSDANGNYLFPGLRVGRYTLEAGKQGFKTYILKNIDLHVNDHVSLNAPLQVGSVTETVEVSSEAPLVQTESAAISNVVDSQRMVDLPLNGRYATQLVLLAGASLNAPGGDEVGSKNFYSSQTISVAGGQANGTNYLLDGGDNNDTFSNVNLPFPFPDALEEFSVETSALPPRNGLHPGGVVNLVTKSGTNQIHGDAFEFYRDGVFNASTKRFVDKNNPAAPKPDNLLRNQFGGTVGGPLIKNKLFWFAGYQATRSRQTANQQTHTATAAALAGDFTALESAGCQSSGKAKTLKGPFTANVLNPGTSYDSAAVNLFSQGFVPVSTDPCGLLNYVQPSINNEDEIIGRVDLNISQKQTLFGRYFIDDYRAPAPFDIHNLIVTQFQGNKERAQTFTLGHTFSFTPTFINSVHATVSRRRDNRAVDPRDINPTTIGVNMFATISDFLLISSTGGYFTLGCGTCAPGFFNVNTAQIADDIDWIRGNHHFAFGVDFIHTQNNTLTGYDENGTFAFAGNVTGDGLADLLLGDYSGFTQSHPQQVAYRENIPSVYAQDTYKVRRNLTITVGVRWEPTLWPSDYFHRGSFFSLSDFLSNVHSSVYPSSGLPGSFPPAGMLYHGDKGVPAAFTNNHWLNFAPRFGIAWDPTGKGNQSIRAGYGLFYDSAMAWFTQRLTSNPPFVDQIDNSAGCGTFSNPWQNYAQGTGCGTANANFNPFPGGGNVFPAGSFWVTLPSTMRPLYMQQWNVSYERQFLNEWAFSIAYLGSRSLHVPLAFDQNYIETSPAVCAEAIFASAGGCTSANEPQRRLLYQNVTANGTVVPATGTVTSQYAEGLGIIDHADDTGYSNYNGLLATIQHRFRRGFSVQANYTYSHCLSVGDFNGDLRQSYYEIQTDPRREYGNCNFDIRHIFNASIVASSPFNGTGVMKWILGGWQFAPSIRLLSGYPVNVVLGKDSLADGNESSGSSVGARPELVPGQQIYVNKWVRCGTAGANMCYQFLNPAAFADPTSSSAPVVINPKTGNVYAYTPVRRNAFHGPGLLRFDAALSRLFPIRERTQLELRFEAFNAINKFNIRPTGGIGSAAGINSSTFGQVTSAPAAGFFPSDYDPRILQFAVKLHF
jgi:hypothetical protein